MTELEKILELSDGEYRLYAYLRERANEKSIIWNIKREDLIHDLGRSYVTTDNFLKGLEEKKYLERNLKKGMIKLLK